MADYGLLQEVRVVPRSASVSVAALVDDTELVIDDAGDFDEDGGTFDLNGAQLAYTGITWGTSEDDDDTLTLAEPLAVAADVDDIVTPVVGGQLVQDWYAVVDMREGDPVHVPLSYNQRLAFTPGTYDSPPPIVVSEDLSRVEDLPGQVPNTAIQFYEDTFTVSETGDQTFTLTYLPLDRSEHLYWQPGGLAGVYQQEGDLWSINDLVVTIPDIGIPFAIGDKITVEYAYLVGGPTGVLTEDPTPPPDPDPDPDATVIVPDNAVTLDTSYSWGGSVSPIPPQWGDDDEATGAAANSHYGGSIVAKRQTAVTSIDAQPSLVVDAAARIALWLVVTTDHSFGFTVKLQSSPLSSKKLLGDSTATPPDLTAPAGYAVIEMFPAPGTSIEDFLEEWVLVPESLLVTPNWPIPLHPPGTHTTTVAVFEARVAIYYP